MPRRRWPSRLKSSNGLGDDALANQGSSHWQTTAARMIGAAATPSQVRLRSPPPGILSERRASSHRTTMAVPVDLLIGGIPRYGKAPASCWRERVDNAGASFAWRAPSSSRPFEGARVLTGYCTLVKGFGNSG